MKKTLLTMVALVATAMVATAQTELFTEGVITGVDSFFGDASWSPETDSKATWDGSAVNVEINQNKDAQWKAQVKVNTTITSFNPDKQYDFSCKIVSNKELGGVTIKLMDNLEVILKNQNVTLTEGENNLSFKNNDGQPGEANGVIVFDFGYAAAGTVLTISEFSLIEHEAVEPVVEVADWDYNSATNLWKAVDEGSAFDSIFMFFADNGWGSVGDAEYEHVGDTWNIVMPAGMGVNQWQGQFHIKTTVSATASTDYNFYCILEAENECPAVTIKLTQDGDDNNFFFDNRHKVKAGEAYVYKAEKVTLRNDAPALKLVFDFAGTAAGTNVKVSKIYFEDASTTSINAIESKAKNDVYTISGVKVQNTNASGLYIVNGKKLVK